MSSEIYQDVLSRIQSVIGKHDEPVALHAPFMNGNEQTYVAQTIAENWVSSAGAFVSRFEKEIAAYCGMDYAVAVVNGTAALHASLYALGVGAGDEVLVPSATFVASGNAISQAGAIPHFIECESNTIGVDPERLRSYLLDISIHEGKNLINTKTGRRIRAVLPVHVFGVPADIDRIAAVAEEFGLILIQDSTEALGSTYKNKSPFTYGSCATLSFNGNKIITSGAGGAILTNYEALAKRLKHITTTAKLPHKFAFFHDEPAFNYRMPNLNAALACAQLEQIGDFLQRKKNLAEKYKAAFEDFEFGSFMVSDETRQPNYWLNTVKLHQPDAAALYEGIGYLNDNGVHCRPLWTPLHMLPMYKACPRMDDLSVTETMAASVINIPSSAFLSD